MSTPLGRHWLWLVLPVVVLALATALIVRAGGTPPERHEIAMRGWAFDPATLEAAPGDTIVWTNHDVVPHTATMKDLSMDSGVIPPGGSWSFVMPEATEHLTYLCIFHPTMTGAISVR
jgi:plastocyanin